MTTITTPEPTHADEATGRDGVTLPVLFDRAAPPEGLEVPRRFTTADGGPFAGIDFALRQARIVKPDGEVVFAMDDVEVPADWEQVAVDVLADKYLRKAGVPQPPLGSTGYDLDGEPLRDADGEVVLGPERSIRQVALRMARAWRIWGERYGYFASADDAQAYEDEMAYMLVAQMGAPNSPQWFNTGLYEAYGIRGDVEGNSYVDPETGRTEYSRFKHERSGASACYIQSVDDTLVGHPADEHNPSIAGLIEREMRLFKAGSGSGSNFSAIRGEGEPLSGGGKSSGLMSFLRVLDTAAGAIKSGGTTRRAAKMVIVDSDHPDVEEFVTCKVREEEKAQALIAAGYDGRYDGEAYQSVAFQNANHSVRVDGDFMDALRHGGDYELTARTTGETVRTLPARELWDQIAAAAWRSADPGLQFDDLINAWHTAREDGPQRATNPCSEYLYLDNTSCNLASLNVTRFIDSMSKTWDADAFAHAVRLWTVTLEITVTMSHYPSPEVARRSYEHRTLGLGYADVGALLMRSGLPYDSDEGRAVMGAVTAVEHLAAYKASAEMARAIGPAPAYARNAEHVQRVVRNHARAAHPAARERLGDYEGLPVSPQEIDHDALARTPFAHLSKVLGRLSREVVDEVAAHGVRNMQTTVLAPTGTISFVLGADTTGVEPPISLIAFKKLAGGGTMTLVNHSVRKALAALGYSDDEVERIAEYIYERGTAEGAPGLADEHLAVFDCALGARAIAPEGHVRALGAVAPFLSGSASKTVNMPNEATVDDVRGIHDLAYELGVKCIAVYRDGSKSSQPLTTENDDGASSDGEAGGEVAGAAAGTDSGAEQPLRLVTDQDIEQGTSPTQFYAGERPPKFRLPPERTGLTRKATVGGVEVIVRTGEYPDGTLGEVFIDLGKDGSTLKGVLSDFSIAVSKQLQAGVPLDDLVRTHTMRMYEPRGVVQGDPNVRMATSIVDYVFRMLAHVYLGDTELVQTPFGEDNPRGPVSRPPRAGGPANADRHPTGPLQPALTVPARSSSETPASSESRDEKPAGSGSNGTAPGGMATGEVCPHCGGILVPNGSCMKCLGCGETTGCS